MNIFKPNGYWFFDPRSGAVGGLVMSFLIIFVLRIIDLVLVPG